MTTEPDRPRRIGRYRVIAAIGAGGMGEVFLAEDDRLGRRVALKRPKIEIEVSPVMIERLLREARHIAQLSHPGIAGIYDIVDEGGVPYIVMEYVEGVDLSDLLVKQGPLPVDDALRIGIGIAEALAVAHEHGLMHRDLKSSNVRITPEGQIKILDFGLSRADPSKAQNDTPTVQSSLVTEQGQIVGSPGYAAPEQLLGQPSDARTDIFSLGVMLYELVTGTLPFPGTDLVSRSLATLSGPLRPAGELRPGLPRPFDELLARALAKRPAERLASARDFAAALSAIRTAAAPASGSVPTAEAPAETPVARQTGGRRRVLSGAVGLAALLVGLTAWVGLRSWGVSSRFTATPDSSSRTIVAVLTPTNLTGDAANDVIAVGFADSLFNDLSGLPALTVVPPDEVRQETQRAGGERRGLIRSLGATYLVDSSIQRSGAQLRVNARLVSSDGQVAWRSDYVGESERVFDLQRRLTEGVIDGLEIRTQPGTGARIGAGRTTNVEALTDYWRGRALLEGADPNQLAEAVKAMESAIARAPDFAEAHAGLAQAYWRRYVITKEVVTAEKAVEASQRALQLDPQQPRVWVTMALVHAGTGHSDQALDDLRRAVELQPNSDDAFRQLGSVLAERGRNVDAAAAYHRAIELRPEYWGNHQALGVFLFTIGRFKEAETAFRTVIRLQPDLPSGYQALGSVLQSVGDLDGARRNYERALGIRPVAPAYSNLGMILHLQGRYREAIASYRKASEMRPRAALYHRNIADAYARLGDRVQAQASYGVAVSLLEEDLRVNPEDVVALTDLAYCQEKLGDAAQARQHLAKAAALQPTNSQVLYLQGVWAAKAGRLAESLTLLKQAVEQGEAFESVRRDDDLEAIRRMPEYVAWVRQRDAVRAESIKR